MYFVLLPFRRPASASSANTFCQRWFSSASYRFTCLAFNAYLTSRNSRTVISSTVFVSPVVGTVCACSRSSGGNVAIRTSAMKLKLGYVSRFTRFLTFSCVALRQIISILSEIFRQAIAIISN